MSTSTALLSFYADELHGYAALELSDGSTSRTVEDVCTWTPEHRQASGLVPLLQRLAKQAGLNSRQLRSQVETILVPKGPTSFTTLRITLSVARALTISIPSTKIFAPSQFHVLAWTALKLMRSVSGSASGFPNTMSPTCNASSQALSVENFSNASPTKASHSPLPGTLVLVLNAFKPGFYGALLLAKEGHIPVFLEPPAFYPPNANFLTQHQALPIFSNLHIEGLTTPLTEGIESNLPLSCASKVPNLAHTQIELYHALRASSDTFDYASLTPFYLDTPLYKKRV